MDRHLLFENIKKKESFLCIGLDTDIKKLPPHLLDKEDPVYEFNKAIIEATHDLCVAYKPNIAFYESMGIKGWQSLQKTMDLIPADIFTIADAKRGDIGNTSSMYARAFFDKRSSGFDFDSVTVAPYMGEDSVKPFIDYPGKWVILLVLTSNDGSKDFQMLDLTKGKKLFEEVLLKAKEWGTADNMMYVVGATRGEAFKGIREIAPDHFLLVPGVGAQGGDLQDVCLYGMNDHCGLLINASRSIIYASSGKDFAEKARKEALKIQAEMSDLLKKHKLI
jgi:orotidine-5'-phosphate decarboxylase